MRDLAAFGLADHLAAAKPNVLRELIQMSLDRKDLVSLAGGLPADELFDAEGLEAASAEVFRSNARTPLQYNATDGLASLKARLAALSAARGIAVDPDRFIVTSGSQQAIDLVARCLVSPGDAVLVERPTFITALQTFRAAEAALFGVESDVEGPSPEAIEAALAEARTEGRRAKLLYLVPTFSNPAGRVTSLARRQSLLALACREGLTILEDDPYGDLWFRSAPPPPLRALAEGDAADHVIYLSSLSKTVSPGLRLGWAVLPEALLPAFKLMKSTADIHSSVLAQAVADAYLASGRLPARIALLRQGYARKAAALAAALGAHLGPRLSFDEPEGGMFLWARLDPALGVSALDVARRALACDVSVVPGDPFYDDRPETDRLRLSFSQGGESALVEGARRLARALLA